MYRTLRSNAGHIVRYLQLRWYRLSIPRKVQNLRKKEVIRVLFVIQELGPWKTESLYQLMLKHERFEPMLLVVDSLDDKEGRSRLEKYLSDCNYDYLTDREISDIQKQIAPEIIFYQKPHTAIPEQYFFEKNKGSLFCFVNYAFHTIFADWGCNQPLQNYLWQLYYENALAADGLSEFMDNKAYNVVVTGLPFMDEMCCHSENLPDPWKVQECVKKRIIWAPHYTITDNKWIQYGTFLQYADFMILLANKYKDKIQFAFKPHPKLKYKLYDIWGKEKTDDYYQQWSEMSNTQLEAGKYNALFKYSDAMIHDCSSFTVEYLYTSNPVMYLTNDPEAHVKDMTPFGKEAFLLHTMGNCEDDIATFVENVINGIDANRVKRDKFYQNNLKSPHNRAACDNIINAILGMGEYKE